MRKFYKISWDLVSQDQKETLYLFICFCSECKMKDGIAYALSPSYMFRMIKPYLESLQLYFLKVSFKNSFLWIPDHSFFKYFLSCPCDLCKVSILQLPVMQIGLISTLKKEQQFFPQSYLKQTIHKLNSNDYFPFLTDCSFSTT